MLGRSDLTRPALALLIGLAIIACLYLAREILIPLALALLFSFLLTPPLRFMERAGAPRGAMIPIVVLAVVLGLASVCVIVGSQIATIAGDLPKYQSELIGKIRAVRQFAQPGAISNAIETFENVRKEIDGAPGAAPASPLEKPLTVEVRNEDGGALSRVMAVLAPLLHPLGTAGITLIFVIFILAQREDIRGRMLVLAGSSDISRTTRALDEAGANLSRLFLLQLALNCAFGVVISGGLWLIGVPSAPLWGLIGAVLRFIPYIGAFLTAVLPLLLAASVGDGWSMAVWTVVLFVVTEPVFGHVIEPLLFGKNAGISPFAVVLSASFWTFLWGPIGLILSTPLTICLVTAARHFEALRFFNMLLGEEAPLTPDQYAYQRMLAEDPVDLARQASEYMVDKTFAAYVDDIVAPAFAMARADLAAGKLEARDLPAFKDVVTEALDGLRITDAATAVDVAAHEPATGLSALSGKRQSSGLASLIDQLRDKDARVVLSIGGRDELDDCLALVCAAGVETHGVRVQRGQAATASVRQVFSFDFSEFDAVVICFAGAAASARVNYICERVARTAQRPVHAFAPTLIAKSSADAFGPVKFFDFRKRQTIDSRDPCDATHR